MEVFHGTQRGGCSFSMDEKNGHFLPKSYVEKRQYPDEFMEMMTRESGIVMAGGDERRERFNEYMEDELPGEVEPQRNEVSDGDYLPTSAEEEGGATADGPGRQQPQQIGEIQPGSGDEGMDVEEHPPPSDTADSDCRGPHGDSHIPGAHKFGDMTR